MSAVRVDVMGNLSLKRQLQLLKMGAAKRRKLLDKVAKAIKKHSVRRAKQQVDLQGRPFAAHSKKRRRKMLTRLVSAKNLKVVATGTQAILSFKNPYHAGIAAKQQHGDVQTVRASDLKPVKPEFYDKPATRKQAKALLEIGFKVKKKSGKGYKKPTMKYIVETFTVGQAGAVLRDLREKAGEQSKISWVTTLPARSFLGATPVEVRAHINGIFDTVKQELNHVAR